MSNSPGSSHGAGRANPHVPDADRGPAEARAADRQLSLRLLRAFELRIDHDLVALPYQAQRVVAFLAIRERPQPRSTVAFSLWADATEMRARGNLRTALWKIHGLQLVDANRDYLTISPAADVDLHQLVAQAKRLVSPGAPLHSEDANAERLSGDLLPEWDEDWLYFERERLRQLRLHALEALSQRLSAAGRHAEAIDAAHAAVAAEPLRETAQRILIRAHLLEGNLSEARRQLEAYRTLMWESIGQPPSDDICRMVLEHRPGSEPRLTQVATSG